MATPATGLRSRERGDSTVIGAIFVMAITIFGMTGVLVWGVPAIQKAQDRTSLESMISEFTDIRESLQVINVQNASRTPTVVTTGGTLAIDEGTSIVVTAGLHSNHTTFLVPGCQVYLDDWQDGDNTIRINEWDCGRWDNTRLYPPGSDDCANTESPGDGLCAYITMHNRSRSTLMNFTYSGGSISIFHPNGDPQPLGDHHWTIELGHQKPSDPTRLVIWIAPSQQLHWRSQSAETDQSVFLEGGMVISELDGSRFIEAQPYFHEKNATSTEGMRFIARIPTFANDNPPAFSGDGAFEAYVALDRHHPRIASDNAYALRFDFDGTLAEEWCNALVLRNDQELRIAPNPGVEGYFAAPGFPCDGTGSSRAILYLPPTAWAVPPYDLWVIHEELQIDLRR